MRLFVAIEFDAESKDSLYAVGQRLKSVTRKGEFTRRENLHLTIVFIGETDAIGAAKQAMDKVNARQFALSVCGLGRFRREGGDIFWMGVEENSSLLEIYHKLYENLTRAGFVLEERRFRPHLTLGRQVVTEEGFDRVVFSKSIPAQQIEVSKISLMKSERVNGKLTYTEIYAKMLGAQKDG